MEPTDFERFNEIAGRYEYILDLTCSMEFRNLSESQKIGVLLSFQGREDVDDSSRVTARYESIKHLKEAFYPSLMMTKIRENRSLSTEEQLDFILKIENEFLIKLLDEEVHGSNRNQESINFLEYLKGHKQILQNKLTDQHELRSKERGDQNFRLNLLHQFGIIQHINKVWELNGLIGNKEKLVKELIGGTKETTIQPLLSDKNDERLRTKKMNDRIENFLNEFNLDIDRIKLP